MIAALMPTYNQANLAFERGEGAWLYTADGRRFVDLGAGIATSSRGHNHPHLVAAIAEQAARLAMLSATGNTKYLEGFARWWKGSITSRSAT